MTIQLTATLAPITTARLQLRAVRKADVGLFRLYAGDRRVAEATQGIPHPLPPGAPEAFVARAMATNPAEEVRVIDGSPAGLPEVLGVLSLKAMDRDQSEVAFWVAPAFWNLRIASEALEGLVAANPQHSRTLFAEAFQDNPGSARVLTHAGFQYLGDAEAFSVARGARVPTWTYLRKMA
jgi:RimJ/RimL family protein N-acetyltransferase